MEFQQFYLMIMYHSLFLQKWKFSKSSSFDHFTSSLHYPQSNGLVERTVKTLKQLLRSAPDPYLTLLSYRATPIPWYFRNPGELLMGRQMRTDVLETTKHFALNGISLQISKRRTRYTRRNKNRIMTELIEQGMLSPFQIILLRTENSQCPGTVVLTANTPRSYLVSTPTGQVRRNRSHFNLQQTNVSYAPTTGDYTSDTQEHSTTMTCS